ncbi:hypothetical protein T492DRAFT_1012217 [Pavlovales sp. CCMP2436]|nr:hypothetical protein T492DRAFT_1012217 [Pavlovales sp. CCMP2436]
MSVRIRARLFWHVCSSVLVAARNEVPGQFFDSVVTLTRHRGFGPVLLVVRAHDHARLGARDAEASLASAA